MSVARAQQEIDSLEFSEWMELEKLEPGEPLRSDIRAASIAYAVMIASGHAPKGLSLADMMVKFGVPDIQPGDRKTVIAKLRQWANAQNSKVKAEAKNGHSRDHRSKAGR